MESETRANRLIHETSPYLRQHARNPVDWHPWGSEALQRAAREDKPIFLSIGYSSCHWCHVMERESFENSGIANLMNDLFVNIKVDREERPDLDRIYMSAVQVITGTGGWPMSVFLTPDLKPFYGGTYFPPDDRFGRPGFPRVLQAVAEAFRTRRDEVETSAGAITDQIARLASFSRPDPILSPAPIGRAVEQLAASFDDAHGGFGRAPKFPPGLALRLLMRRYAGSGELSTLRMVRATLDAMADGGLYDHVGGGFHRYSTDERWLVPHFEKMLYDQAMLGMTYLEGFQATGDARYARVARETLDYLLSGMAAPEGGFYSAEDADDPRGEGVFYTWTPGELRAELGEADAELFARAYNVDDIGSLEGRSVLNRLKSDEDLAGIYRISAVEAAGRLAGAMKKLRVARSQRPRPLRDEKVLVDWNGLALSAFARGSRVLGDDRYRIAAERLARFLLADLRDGNGGLLHVWTNGQARVPAFLDDHASLLAGMVDLYEATGDAAWLREASSLKDAMVRRFWDGERGGFFDTTAQQSDVIVRTRSADDGSVPSGNGLAAYGMIRFARITNDADALDRGARTLRAFAPLMDSIPTGSCQMLLALDLFLAPPREIALIGAMDAPETRALRDVVDRLFLPNAVVMHGEGADEAGMVGLKGKGLVDGRPAAYICSNFACQAPVMTPEELEGALRR